MLSIQQNLWVLRVNSFSQLTLCLGSFSWITGYITLIFILVSRISLSPFPINRNYEFLILTFEYEFLIWVLSVIRNFFHHRRNAMKCPVSDTFIKVW